MERYNLNGKAVMVSGTAPREIDAIWVELDTDLKTIKDIKEFRNTVGNWVSILKYGAPKLEEKTLTIEENTPVETPLVIVPSQGKDGISKITINVNVQE